MKKTFLCVLILFFFVGFNSVAFAQTITVSGAGSAGPGFDVNGNYDHMFLIMNGKYAYSRTAGDVRFIFWQLDNVWAITDGEENLFYINTANTSYPPAGGWQVATYGVAPIPTLSGDVDPMPVELTWFTVIAKGKNVELQWNTATETNNYGFEVERKIITNEQLALNNWNKIGFVEGNGTSNTSKSYNYADANVSGTVHYRLKQIDRDGKFEYSNVVEATVAEFTSFSLDQNYPNPFNPVTMINYQLPMNCYATLKVYDALGREAATLVNEVKEAGNYTVHFDGSKLSNGVYFYTLKAGKFIASKKLSLIK